MVSEKFAAAAASQAEALAGGKGIETAVTLALTGWIRSAGHTEQPCRQVTLKRDGRREAVLRRSRYRAAPGSHCEWALAGSTWMMDSVTLTRRPRWGSGNYGCQS
jgi:hypothetical protein